MTTYAGYYMSPEECWRWLEIYRPEVANASAPPGWPDWSAAPGVENGLTWLLTAKKLTSKYWVKIVPALKPIVRDGKIDWYGLMLVRRSSKRKKYFAPDTRPGSSDLRSKRMAEKYAHVRLSDWIVIWYEDDEIKKIKVEVLQPTSRSST